MTVKCVQLVILHFVMQVIITLTGEGKLGEGKLWFQTGADGARLASSGKST